MIAEITFTAAELGGVLAVFVFLGGLVLLGRKVFNFAKADDLEKLATTVTAELEKHSSASYVKKEDLEKLTTAMKEEFERHSKARHEMRHEITRLEVSLGKVETQVQGNTRQLDNMATALNDLPEKIVARLRLAGNHP